MRRFSGTAAAATLGAALLASALPAQAAVLVTIQEVGPDVLISGSGTVNTAALIQDSYTGWFGPNIFPAGAQILLGTLPPAEFDTIRYRGITGPASFGPVSAYFIASSGDVFGVSGGSGFLHLPLYGPGFTNPYVSGTQLSATATVNNATLQDMGLVAGTYTWTWGTGVNADSFTVQIGAAPPPPPTPVPGPSALGLFAAAIGMLAVGRRRRTGA